MTLAGDAFGADRDRHDRISISTLWVALGLSVILHALLLWGWMPKLLLRPSEDGEPGKPRGSLAVRIAPPPSRPPVVAPSPPAAPVAKAPPAPVQSAPRPRVAPKSPSAPRVLAVEQPSPAPAPPVSVETPRPPVQQDFASYVEARRRAREGWPAAAPAAAPAPVETERERHNREVAANLGLNRAPGFGAERDHGGGIFQIARMGYEDAEFFFFGWNKDIRRNSQQMIEVRRGNNPSMEVAVVRRMIVIIREHEKGDFVWESQRLRRNVTLSARLIDNAGLEDFILRDFFPELRGR